MNKSNGGPAFPRPVGSATNEPYYHISYEQDGMSLREWFAGHALIGLLAAGAASVSDPSDIAHDAYLLANAMLKEGER